jgi:hypothetical protein
MALHWALMTSLGRPAVNQKCTARLQSVWLTSALNIPPETYPRPRKQQTSGLPPIPRGTQPDNQTGHGETHAGYGCNRVSGAIRISQRNCILRKLYIEEAGLLIMFE